MNCLKPECQADNLREYPVCEFHEKTCHFTDRSDCRCCDCATNRAVAARAERRRLAEIAWEEEMRIYYGWPVQAAV
jgi:hypothetical protein